MNQIGNNFENLFPMGKLSLIVGMPNRGKTDLLLRLLRDRANNKDGVLLFSLELASVQISKRLLLDKAGITLNLFDIEKVTEQQTRKISQAATELQGAPVWIEDTIGMNIDYLCSKTIEMQRDYAITCVFVGCLGLVQLATPTIKKSNDIYLVIDRLKELSKKIRFRNYCYVYIINVSTFLIAEWSYRHSAIINL